ncbi:MAG: hypothetical protein ACI9MC_000027 [Kiritimatiellia bacterium]|jgi:hypothetical protein
MSRWILLLIAASSTSALAGAPGSSEPTIAVGIGATIDPDARSPVGIVLDGRAELPVGLHLRAELTQFRFPDRNTESFMLENAEVLDVSAAPDSVVWRVYEARLTAAWGLKEASRDAGLRARLGGLLVAGGSSGAAAQLEPLGWQSDLTRFAKLGPIASVGLALPFGDDPGDPLLDVRVAGSFVIPITAGGGALSTDARQSTLSVDQQTFKGVGLISPEARAYIEATLWLDAIMFSAELGMEHNPISALSAARAESEDWNEADRSRKPTPHAALKVALVF